MISLYGLSSPNVMKVAIALDEMRLDHQLVPFDIFQGGQFEPDFQRLSPNSKVPVIVDHDRGDLAIFESCAILLYLADRSELFCPPAQRMTIIQWLFLQAASIGPAFGQAMHFLTAAPGGNDYSTARHLTEVNRLYGVVERQLVQHAHIAGPDYTIADMATFPWLRLHARYGVRLNDFPHVGAWLDRLCRRESVARVVDLWPKLKAETLGNRAAATADQLDRVYGRGRYRATHRP